MVKVSSMKCGCGERIAKWSKAYLIDKANEKKIKILIFLVGLLSLLVVVGYLVLPMQRHY